LKQVLNYILNIIDFIFYRSYKNEEKKWASVPKFHAVIQVSLIINLIILNIAVLVDFIFNFQFFSEKNKQIGLIIVLLIEIIVAFSVYLFYFNNKRYLKILTEFNRTEKNIIKKQNLKANLFIIFSIILAIILTIISAQINY